jgi:hypothetical protein
MSRQVPAGCIVGTCGHAERSCAISNRSMAISFTEIRSLAARQHLIDGFGFRFSYVEHDALRRR